MHIRTILEELEEIAPPDLADEDDASRIGLVVEGEADIRTICCSVDVTPRVVQQAIDRGSTLIIAHHTPFYNPLQTIRGDDAHLLRALLGARINLYIMHTNFDRAAKGVNQTLALLLGMKKIEEMPIGVLGECQLSLPEMQERLNTPLKLYGTLTQPRTLAVVGGSGFHPELIEYAWYHGAEAFLSAELKHHVALRSPLPLLESTHYGLEAPAMRRLAKDRDWFFIESAPLCRYIG
ncbi:MAG: Nif3-like dinuclear metal center hexameric protein [Methanomicrobiales archaeon]|nr:Nif3-like dinuclear metal center hexameric protein [Methanomicrobiales archaeon]